MLKTRTYFLSLILFSCVAKQQHFDIKSWNCVDGTYNHRDLMIEDLMNNFLHKGMSYNQVENILGLPNENKFNSNIRYEIYYDMMSEETRYLKISFAKDSTIMKYSRVIDKDGR